MTPPNGFKIIPAYCHAGVWKLANILRIFRSLRLEICFTSVWFHLYTVVQSVVYVVLAYAEIFKNHWHFRASDKDEIFLLWIWIWIDMWHFFVYMNQQPKSNLMIKSGVNIFIYICTYCNNLSIVITVLLLLQKIFLTFIRKFQV